MTFAGEVGAYRFRLIGPRFRATKESRYLLPRPNGSAACVLEGPQLVLDTNNVDLGPVEADLKAPLRELSAIAGASALACGAVVNAAVRHMAEELAFVNTGVGDGFLFLAGMLGNDQKTCVGIDDFGADGSLRDAFRTHFDARRSGRHRFYEGDYRAYFDDEDGPRIGVYLHNARQPYDRQLEALRAAEPRFADDCLIIVDDSNRDARRRATLDFARESGLAWRSLLDEPTAGNHPTLWNGLMVLQAGRNGGPDSPLELATETGLVDPVELPDHTPGHPPRVTVLHYRNPWVGAQDYPNLEIVGLNRGQTLTEAFESSTATTSWFSIPTSSSARTRSARRCGRRRPARR